MMSKKVNGIGLLSGGLDSILAVKVLQEQGLELIGLTFVTPFFGPKAGLDAGVKAGIRTIALDISESHLQMLKKPRYGYGSQINPCIDCHGLMLREAGKLMEQQGADFLFTGEVLGQRPMSQRRDSLRSVEKLSGYQGRILRPLSAKLLDPTLLELEGIVDRERLLDIQGRSRRRQAELAEYFGIKDYPQPGGGCMLTKEGFARRLRELLSCRPEARVEDVEILKWGRAFRLPGGHVCMVGRQQTDNRQLEKLARERDVHLRSFGHPGPTCVVVDVPDPLEVVGIAAQLVASYSDGPPQTKVSVQWAHNGQKAIIVVESERKETFKEMLI